MANGAASSAWSPGGDKKFIGIQLDSIAAADDGIERVLDEVQQRASVNVIMPDCLWFTPSVSAAELEKSSVRGNVRDPHSKFINGRMGFVDPRYYKDAGLDLKPLTREAGGADMLAAFCAEAKRRGVRVIPIVKDYLPDGDRPLVGVESKGWENLCEYDFSGQRATTSCKNNPHYRNLLAGVMEDLIRSYEVDGIMYIAERQGAFSDTLGLRFRGIRRGQPGGRTCFCPHCRQKAKTLGIDVDRAVEGFQQLEKFVAEGRAKRRPLDGYYATLWRLMLRYPELLGWEHLWYENVRELYRHLNSTIKRVRPGVLYGMHVWPNINMSPLISAEHDFGELGQYHDFIKLSLYSNCGGPRFGTYIDSVSQTMYGDLPPEEVLQFHYRVMNYDEAPMEKIRQTGLKRDFVYRETKRAVTAAKATPTLILAGIDVDIKLLSGDMGPADPKSAPKTTRHDVQDAVTQAFKAGAPGVVLSRQYAEMKLENLSGAGDAIREIKVKT